MFYTSYYLAKVIGLNMSVIGLLLLLRPNKIRSAIEAILESRGLLFLFGILNLILGAVLINLHNLWVMDWQVIIILIGWIVFKFYKWSKKYWRTRLNTKKYGT